MRVRLLNIHPQRAIIYFPKRVEFFHDPFLPDGERERGTGEEEGRGGEERGPFRSARFIESHRVARNYN